MKIISLIAAVSQNDVIGNNNQLIWHLPADLQHFKKITMNKPIIMGRKTFEAIGRPLPGRMNIVITRNIYFSYEGVSPASSLEEALEIAGEVEEIMIIGGGEVYAKALPLASRIYLTRIYQDFEGDTFFPKITSQEWRIVSEEFHQRDEKNPYDYAFFVLENTKI